MDRVTKMRKSLLKSLQGMMIVAVVAGLSSCATVKGWFGGGGDRSKPVVAEQAVSGDQKAECEAELRKLVSSFIQTAERDQEDNQTQVIRRKPYFYKEYAVYPKGPDGFELSLQETESRTRPYIAGVKMEKIRFSTHLHRERSEAVGDTQFLRDTGMETLSFELRNGRWTRVGSVFVAEKTEQNVNGQWVPIAEEQKRTVESEEQPGWFSRTWNKVLGRD